MTRKAKKYLFDIKTAAEKIQNQYLSTATSYKVLETDDMLRDAIERQIIIIGEAVYRLKQSGVVLSDYDRIINRRNTLVHQYDVIKAQTLWTFCKFELVTIKTEVESLLAS